MKRKVPKKNIASDIADIEKPRGSSGSARRTAEEDPIRQKAAAEFAADRDSDGAEIEEVQRKVPLKKIFFAVFIIFAAVAGWFGVQAYARWHKVADSLQISSGQIGSFLGNKNLEPGTGNAVKSSGFDFSDLKAIFGNAGAIYKNFGKLSGAGLDLAEAIDGFQNDWADLLFGNRGAELVARLKQVRSDLSAVGEANRELSSASLDLSHFLPGGASPLSLDLGLDQAGRFLDTLIAWLESPDTHHVLVLFGNSSELRPGGGFTGSYADVAVKSGNVANIDVRDINDADRLLTRNIVPPKPLQAIATRWRASDANWFFDYELSAGKTAEFIEASKLYRASSTKFDIAVEVSPNIVTDILELTGPISLPDPSNRLGRAGRKLTIDKNNFLNEIQKEVEAEQRTGNAKEILQELEPLLLEKVRSLPAEGKRALAAKFPEWIAKKDMMLYGKDSVLEKFFESYGAAGNVFPLSADFNGDYLAVVNANIGSKTDAVISQKIIFRSQLNLDGTVSDHLTITRQHRGNKSSYWWYRAANQDYLQVFTPTGAALSNFSGGWNRTVYPRINYRTTGYEIDPLVAEIESSLKEDFNYPFADTFSESGKNVFASWVRTVAGDTSTIKLDYSVRLFAPPADGVQYQFVFERQPAAKGTYKIELYAPAGFRWKENRLPVFEYATDDPDGRTVFNLTLEKIL